jgi:hypothetical protein
VLIIEQKLFFFNCKLENMWFENESEIIFIVFDYDSEDSAASFLFYLSVYHLKITDKARF